MGYKIEGGAVGFDGFIGGGQEEKSVINGRHLKLNYRP